MMSRGVVREGRQAGGVYRREKERKSVLNRCWRAIGVLAAAGIHGQAAVSSR